MTQSMVTPKYRYADEVSDGNVPIQIRRGEQKHVTTRFQSS